MSATPRVLGSIADALLEHQQAFNALDAAAGDGDMGTTLARGARAVRDVLAEAAEDDKQLLLRCGERFAAAAGGTSGPLWGAALLAAADVAGPEPTRAVASAMLRAAASEIALVGGARVGDKTLLDALEPAVAALAEATGATGDALRAAADAAAAGAASTAGMKARRGRAAYSGGRSVGAPDAGAVAVATVLDALATAWVRPAADAVR
jgi:dihydroxyacetone kinase